MIKVTDFYAVLQQLQVKYSEYDEHLLRLHLMAYSVYEQIHRKKLGWFLLKHIEWNYYGLIRFELVQRMLEEDPFCLRDLDDNILGDLHKLIWFQVSEFRARSRDRLFSAEFEDYEHLLNELAVLDRDAVRDLADDDQWREEHKDDLVTFVSKYMHSIFVQVDDKKLIIEPERLNLDSYRKFADFHIYDYFYSDRFLNPDKILKQIFDDDFIGQSQSIYCFNGGVGTGLLHLVETKPETDLISVEIRTRNICENFLCEINLWPLNEQLAEPSVSAYGDPFEDYQTSDDDPSQQFDRVVGVVSEHDALGVPSLSKKFFRLSHKCTNFENVYVELLTSKVNDTGYARIAVPERFLFSNDSRTIREVFLSEGTLNRITQLSKEKYVESMGTMTLLDYRSNADSGEGVTFVSGESIIGLSAESIRLENPDLDLRPSRFLNTPEYEFREILEVFELELIDKKMRPQLLTIIRALDRKSGLEDLFNPTRKILEAIYHSLLSLEPSDSEVWKNKDTFFTDSNGIHFDTSRKFLYGARVERWPGDKNPIHRKNGRLIPPDVNASAMTAQKLTNPQSHYYKDGHASVSAFRSAVFSLFHLIEWLKSVS